MCVVLKNSLVFKKVFLFRLLLLYFIFFFPLHFSLFGFREQRFGFSSERYKVRGGSGAGGDGRHKAPSHARYLVLDVLVVRVLSNDFADDQDDSVDEKGRRERTRHSAVNDDSFPRFNESLRPINIASDELHSHEKTDVSKLSKSEEKVGWNSSCIA